MKGMIFLLRIELNHQCSNDDKCCNFESIDTLPLYIFISLCVISWLHATALESKNKLQKKKKPITFLKKKKNQNTPL